LDACNYCGICRIAIAEIERAGRILTAGKMVGRAGVFVNLVALAVDNPHVRTVSGNALGGRVGG